MFNLLTCLSASNAVSEAQFRVPMGKPKTVPVSDSILRRWRESRELHLITPRSLSGDSLLEEQPEGAVDVVAVLLLLLLVTSCSYSNDEGGITDKI